MAGNIKGITIELNAETKNFNKALKDISTSTKSLETELRSVNAALKLDPKNVELLKQKQDLLTKAVDESKQSLKVLKDTKDKADKDMASGTQINQEQYRKLQREIAFAEGKVKNFEQATKNNTEAIKKSSREIDIFGDKTEKLNKASNTMLKVATGGAVAITGMAVKSAQAADDINTMSKVTGLSTEEIQKYQYAAERIDVPIETLTGSMSKMTKNMATATKGTGDAYNAFKVLGVEFKNQDGTLRDKQEVFADVTKALAGIDNETQRDAYAMQIFGKSAQDLNPLILGGADSLKKYGKEAEDAGLILSQDALGGANEFQDGIDKLKATVTAGVGKMGGQFATVLVPAIEKATKVLEKVVNFIAKNKVLVMALVAVLGTLAIGIKAITTAQKILNIVMAANPIGLIIIAIAALVAAFVVLWNNCNAFRNFWISLWNGIVNVVKAAINWIKENWKTIILFFINPVGTIFKYLYDNCDAFRNFINNVLSAIGGFFKNTWNGILNVARGTFNGIIAVVNFFKNVWTEAWSGMKNIFSAMWNGLVNIAKGPINLIIGLINSLIGGINYMISGLNKVNFEMPEWDWLPNAVQGKSFGINIPKIDSVSYLAEGGILNQATLFGMQGNKGLIGGEAGAEAVIPLSKLPGLMKDMGNTYNVTYSNPNLTIQQMSAIDKMIARRMGGAY